MKPDEQKAQERSAAPIVLVLFARLVSLIFTSVHVIYFERRKKEKNMNIAVFADLHGRVLLAFKLCARWQRETGEHIDLILQAGDLGAYPERSRLDRATIRYAERDPTELGFMEHFVEADPQVEAVLAETSCPMVFVRGNHEDHFWLDELERQSKGAIFPVDVYQRVYNLKTGMLWTFQQQNEQLTVFGIGRIGPPTDEAFHGQGKYIQPYESTRVYRTPPAPVDVLLTHHSRTDFVILDRGVKIKASTGMKEIEHILDENQPAYHFYGHYGGPPQVRLDTNGITLTVKLADLQWERGSSMLEPGSMGLLRWHNRDEHAFEVLEHAWLREYSAFNW
jgi:Icc-related predicted phosphoesterase